MRFFRLGLWRKYPFFVTFLIVDMIGAVWLMRYNPASREYAAAYPTVNGIMLFFRVAFAAELYERICDHFPGIGVFRTVMAAVLVVVAGLVAVFTFRPDFAGLRGYPVETMIVVQRFQHEILAGVLILTWIFLRFVLSIRQPFRPNVLTHWTIATVYFGAAGAAYLASDLTTGPAAVYLISSVMLAIQLGCLVAWTYKIGRSGENLPPFARLSPDQATAAENYNRELLGTVTSLPAEISARQTERRDNR
ncbi:MAG TPA: hypothetical protein VFW44_09735 [Bryobacteraceae bacterium]|nr:hypothetical protein [Bryobacteraceae bacterium]